MPSRPGELMQPLDRGLADAALGHIDDALEGEVVVGRAITSQIGDGVPDFLALVEARAADHPIGQAERDEAVLEGAHLERGAHQDGDVVEAFAVLRCSCSMSSPIVRASSSPSQAAHGDLLARVVVGPQRLAEPALVVGDQAGGGAEDMRRGAVVALQPDDLGAGKILLEAQDVVDLGAAPAIDRLVVVADTADVLLALGQQPQPQILRDVGVLVFVDQHVVEAALIVGEHVRDCPGTAAGLRAAGRRNRRRSAPSGAPGRRR